MIKNQWYVIASSKEVALNKPVAFKRLGQKIVLWRKANGEVACIEDRCCHRGASLAKGKVLSGQLECPFHGFRYDELGKVRMIPASGKSQPVPDRFKVKGYIVVEQCDLIWLWWGDDSPKPGQPCCFSFMKGGFTYSEFVDHWSVHYSRAIENQLDVLHLPFVHATTIGRGNKTVVNGPVVDIKGNLLTFYVNNVRDDGQMAKKSAEITEYASLPQLQFHFPNIWQNIISDKVRAFAAFVPVDEENTLVYIRYYSSVKLPVLRRLFNWIGKVASIIILRQDNRIVITQLPKKSTLKMNEQLTAGDLPIVVYRKHRQQLQEASD